MSRHGVLLPTEDGFWLKLQRGVRGHRRRWVVAHELGHTYFFDLKTSPPRRSFAVPSRKASQDTEEWLASWIAREILVPKEMLDAQEVAAKRVSLETFFNLGGLFDVSPDVIAWRLFRDYHLWAAIVFFLDSRDGDFVVSPNGVFKGPGLSDINVSRTLRESPQLRSLVQGAREVPGEELADKVYFLSTRKRIPLVVEARAYTHTPARIVALARFVEA